MGRSRDGKNRCGPVARVETPASRGYLLWKPANPTRGVGWSRGARPGAHGSSGGQGAGARRSSGRVEMSVRCRGHGVPRGRRVGAPDGGTVQRAGSSSHQRQVFRAAGHRSVSVGERSPPAAPMTRPSDPTAFPSAVQPVACPMKRWFHAPPPAWTRARSLVTVKPARAIRSTKAGSSVADQTARQPPGRSATRARARPAVV
jgi:hypothetical protein